MSKQRAFANLLHNIAHVNAFGLRGSYKVDMLTSDIADKIADRLNPPPETLSFRQEKEYERLCLENERKARNRRQIDADLYWDACKQGMYSYDPKKIDAINKKWLDWLDKQDQKAFNFCSVNFQPTGFFGFLAALLFS